jgi:hypothetical protein
MTERRLNPPGLRSDPTRQANAPSLSDAECRNAVATLLRCHKATLKLDVKLEKIPAKL